MRNRNSLKKKENYLKKYFIQAHFINIYNLPEECYDLFSQRKVIVNQEPTWFDSMSNLVFCKT